MLSPSAYPVSVPAVARPESGPAVARPERAPRPARVPRASGDLAGADVVLVILDALRADALSAYGAHRPTPSFDALADGGTLVDRALSVAAWTAPAMASVLSGLHPDAHGVDRWQRPLPATAQTIPETFAAAGYHTLLWSSHTLYRANPSLRRGFADIHLLRVEERDWLPSAELLRTAPGQPLFALVHLLVPHAPYAAPAPFARRYTSAQARALDVSPPALRHLGPADAPLVAAARDRYDENVAWADAQLGRIAEALREAGRLDRTLLVVTSDHGEAFLEHGLMLHTRDLHDEMVRIPLLFRWPAAQRGRFPARVAGPASLVDVPPTLLDLLGLKEPLPMHGRSLRALLGGARPRRPGDDASLPLWATTRGVRPAGAERRPALVLLELGGYKLLLDTHSGQRRLYRPATDPAERIDLAPTMPQLAERLGAQAMAQRRADRSMLRRLRSPSRQRKRPRPAEAGRGLSS